MQLICSSQLGWFHVCALCLRLGASRGINQQSILFGPNKGGLNPGGEDQEGFTSVTQEVCSGEMLSNSKKDTGAAVMVKAVLGGLIRSCLGMWLLWLHCLTFICILVPSPPVSLVFKGWFVLVVFNAFS